MRKLATIRKINEVKTHPNADALDLARIGGWQVVVKRNQFKAGELCVYCEIDSVLPDKTAFAFLKDKGFRIKTIKLRGQLSQGICFSFSDLQADYPEFAPQAREENEDVTDALGVSKYEPAAPGQSASDKKGEFPAFLRKTDAERIQNLTPMLEYYWQLPNWLVTEKLDGTSFTCFFQAGEFGVCSRNFELLPTEASLYWKMARALDLENKLKAFGRDIAVQGEIVGAGIQGNKYRLPDQQLFVFKIVEIEGYQVLDLESACKQLNLTPVPLLQRLPRFPWTSAEELISYATGKSLIGSTPREGVVICTEDHQVLFKSISNDFLLKYGE